MAVSVQIYLTVGIAMVGASAIAIAPIGAPPPHIQNRASHPVVVDDVNLTAFTPTGFLNAAETILGGFESASTVRTGAASTRSAPPRSTPAPPGSGLWVFLEKRSWCRLRANAQ